MNVQHCVTVETAGTQRKKRTLWLTFSAKPSALDIKIGQGARVCLLASRNMDKSIYIRGYTG